MPQTFAGADTWFMRKSWFACFLGTLLVGGLPAAAVLANVDRQADPDRSGGAAVVASVGAADKDADTDVDRDAKKESKTEKDEEKAARGHGPPPWAALGHRGQARGHGQARGLGADADWKEAWRKLTPAQRERTMTDLAKAHAEGMQEWAECVSAAGDDHAQRAACEKPLPPGLAKRQP